MVLFKKLLFWFLETTQSCKFCDAKDAEIRRLLKLVANLTLENSQLKANHVVKQVEEKQTFTLIAPPLNNAHWGTEDQEAVDSALVEQLPHFTTLLRFGRFIENLKWVLFYYFVDGLVYPQIKYMDKYNALSDFKRTLFHQFLSMIETMMCDPNAKERFSDFVRVDALRLAYQMSDIQNDPTSSNDWLLANKDLCFDSRGDSRPEFRIT